MSRRTFTLLLGAIALVALVSIARRPRIQHRVEAALHVHELFVPPSDSIYANLLDRDYDGDGCAELMIEIFEEGRLNAWSSFCNLELTRHPRSPRVVRVSSETGAILEDWQAPPRTVFKMESIGGGELHLHQENWSGRRPCLTHPDCPGSIPQLDLPSHRFAPGSELRELRFERPPSRGLIGQRRAPDLVLELANGETLRIDEEAWASDYLITEALLRAGVILRASHALPRMGAHLRWVEVIDLRTRQRERFELPRQVGEFRMNSEGAWSRIDADGYPTVGLLRFEDTTLVACEYVLGAETGFRELARFPQANPSRFLAYENLFDVADCAGQPIFLHAVANASGNGSLSLRVILPQQGLVEHPLPVQLDGEAAKYSVTPHSMQWAVCRDRNRDGVDDLLVTIAYTHHRQAGLTWILLSGATGEVLPR